MIIDTEIDYAAVGRRIRQLRGATQTQAEFGNQFGKSAIDLGRLERGDVKPSADFLHKISKACRVTLEWILTGRGWSYFPLNPKDAYEWVYAKQEKGNVSKAIIVSYTDDAAGVAKGIILQTDEGVLSMCGSDTRAGYKGAGPGFYAKVLALLDASGVPVANVDKTADSASLNFIDLASLADTEASDDVLRTEKEALNEDKSEPQDEFIFLPINTGGKEKEAVQREVRVAFSRQWMTKKGDPKKMYLFEVSGDSMEPTLRTGDLVLIDHARSYVDPQGGLYAISFDGVVVIKRVEIAYPSKKLKVISDNSKYETVEVAPDNVKIQGKIIWFSRDLA